MNSINRNDIAFSLVKKGSFLDHFRKFIAHGCMTSSRPCEVAWLIIDLGFGSGLEYITKNHRAKKAGGKLKGEKMSQTLSWSLVKIIIVPNQEKMPKVIYCDHPYTPEQSRDKFRLSKWENSCSVQEGGVMSSHPPWVLHLSLCWRFWDAPQLQCPALEYKKEVCELER